MLFPSSAICSPKSIACVSEISPSALLQVRQQRQCAKRRGALRLPSGAVRFDHSENTGSNDGFMGHISYKPTNEALLYASWSQGFRLGLPRTAGLPTAVCDTNNDGLIDGTNAPIESTRKIDSDSLDNYEIGGKFRLFNQRLVVDTAVYHMDWTGLPASTLAPAPPVGCGLRHTANLGEATSEGLELQASLLVMQGLRFDLGGG